MEERAVRNVFGLIEGDEEPGMLTSTVTLSLLFYAIYMNTLTLVSLAVSHTRCHCMFLSLPWTVQLKQVFDRNNV